MPTNTESNSSINSAVLKDKDILSCYTNNWFAANYCWQVPNLQELKPLTQNKKKAHITKSVIGLRKSLEQNNSAFTNEKSLGMQVVRSYCDGWMNEFGFTNEAEKTKLEEKKSDMLNQYKKCQQVITSLNKNMGHRAAAACFLVDGKNQNYNLKLLTIVQLLKQLEPSLNQGLMKTELLKFSVSMHKEMKQEGYVTVIERLNKELTEICNKVQAGLNKLPAGLVSTEPVKTYMANKIREAGVASDPRVVLCHTFDEVAKVYCAVNAAVSAKLARVCNPIEKKYDIFSIDPDQTH